MAYVSEEGYNKLLADLKQLEAVERPKIVAAIAEARDKGELSENAEYDAAKEAQGLLESKIAQLKAVIGEAKILDASKLKTDSVQIYGALKGMVSYLNFLVTPSKSKRFLIDTVLRLTGTYKELHGLMINYTGNTACADSTKELFERFRPANKMQVNAVCCSAWYPAGWSS